MKTFFFQHTLQLQGLVVLRIAVSTLLGLQMLLLWSDIPMLFGKDALADPLLIQLRQDGYGPTLHSICAYLSRWNIAESSTLIVSNVLYVLSCLLLAVGYRTRLMAFVVLCFHQLYFLADSSWAYGFDYIAVSALFYIAWVGNISYRSQRSAPWWKKGVLRTFQLHIVLIYSVGGLSKLLSSDWRSGEALWKAVQQSYPGSWLQLSDFIHYESAIWLLMSWPVIFIELLFVFVFCSRSVRTVLVSSAVAMHVIIAISLGLYSFSILMVSLVLCAFYFPYIRQIRPFHTHRLDPTSANSKSFATVWSIQRKEAPIDQ